MRQEDIQRDKPSARRSLVVQHVSDWSSPEKLTVILSAPVTYRQHV